MLRSLVFLSALLLADLVSVHSLSGTCNSYEREKLNEGYKPRVYMDTEGHPTVGIGFNLDKANARKQLSSVRADYDSIRAGTATLDDYQIRSLFYSDMEDAVNCASSWLSDRAWSRMSTDRKSAVADMAFNLGCAGLKKFKKMKAALERQDYSRAAAEMKDSDWCVQVGRRCVRNVDCMTEGLSTLLRLLQGLI